MSAFETIWLAPLLDYLTEQRRDSSFERGMKYGRDGRVRGITLDPGLRMVSARIQGTHMYDTALTVVGEGKRADIDVSCSCPVSFDCKHGIALAADIMVQAARIGIPAADKVFSYMSANSRFVWHKMTAGNAFSLDPLFEGWRPPPVKSSVATAKSKSAPPPAAPPRSILEARGKPKPPPWERLLTANDTAEERKILMEWIKSQMNPRPMDWDLEPAVRKLIDSGSPIAILHLLPERWSNLVHSYYYGKPKPLPPEFFDFLKRPDIVAQFEAEKKQDAERALLGWLEGPSQREAGFNATTANVDIRWTTIPYMPGIDRLAFEFLLTTPRLDRSPRGAHQIEGLVRELDQNKRILPPGEEAIVRWIYSRSNPPGMQADRVPAPPTSSVNPIADVTMWIGRWNGIETFHWMDGPPVIFSAYPMRLGIDGEAGNSWCLEFLDAESGQTERIPVAEAQILTDSVSIHNSVTEPAHLYCHHRGLLHRVDAGAMPLATFGAALYLKQAPVDTLRERGLIGQLAEKLAPSRHEVDQRTAPPSSLIAELPVKVRLELRLTEGNILRIAAFADSGDGIAFHKVDDGGWKTMRPLAADEAISAVESSLPALVTPEGAPPGYFETEPPPGDWRELGESLPSVAIASSTLAVMPMREHIGPLDEWLGEAIDGAFDFVERDGVCEVVWPMTRMDMTDFLDAWERRPLGVDYLGDAAFRRMAEVQGAPRLSVKAEPSGMNWLEVSVEFEEELSSISLDEMRRAMASGTGQLVRLGNGRTYRREDLIDFEKQLGMLNDLGIELTEGPQRLHALQAAGASSELMDAQKDLDALQVLGDRVRELVRDFKGVPDVPIGEIAAGYLRPYQREGVNFLAWAARSFGGALLADEMGLGKTLQILAALAALRAEGETGPSIVFCPASVAHNWEREAAKFTPDLRVLVLERGAGRKELMSKLVDHDLIVINYALARREAPILAETEWLVAICDEAQAIKNPQADTARLVKQLKSKYRFALTGTPIENRAGDLFSIMDFAAPGYLRHDPALASRTNEDAARAAFRKLRARLRPVLLRRLKSEVATDLPERIEERLDCEMTEGQRKAYLAEVKRTRDMLGGMKTSGLIGKERIQILAAITRLRQLCCDPDLVGIPDTGSGKVDELMNLLGPILEGGHKVLLFSQFVRMLERIEARLIKENIPYYKLTGATANRGELVNSFEGDPRPVVFLISLKAGGTGLNLVSASHVILFDPWWNPAVEAQAIDRAHRIGQDKTVIAFRLVTRGTIEERILELQGKKMNIVRNVLEEDAFNRTLSREDFEYLLDGGEKH